MANLPRSGTIHLRPSFSATAAVVPEPQKKSATRSPSLDDVLMMRLALYSIKPKKSKIEQDDLIKKMINKEKFDADDFSYSKDLMELVAKGFDTDLKGARPDFEKLFHYIKLSYCMKFNEQDLKIYQKLYEEKMANLNGNNDNSRKNVLKSTSSGSITQKSVLLEGAEAIDPYYKNGVWIAERMINLDIKELYWVINSAYISEKDPNGKVKDGSFGFDLYFTDQNKRLILLVSSEMPYAKLHYKKFLKPIELPV